MRSHSRAGDPVEESPTGDRQAVLGSSAYLASICIDNLGVKPLEVHNRRFVSLLCCPVVHELGVLTPSWSANTQHF
jgi:hypothetical protein